MNTKILAAVIAATLITSCSSLYKATSTPDDIYYSPSPATAKATATDAGYDQYENAQSSNDDQYLRMKVQNQTLWGNIDDYSYWNDSRYDYGYSCNSSRIALLTGLYSPYGYNSYFASPYMGLGYGGFGYGYGWNNWNSPYQTVVLYKSPSVYANTNKANLTAYHNVQYNNTNRNKYNTSNGYQNGNYTTRGGSYNNNSNSNYVAPARSFSTSSSSNSAGGRSGGFSSSGSSAGGSRATRH